MGHKRAWIQILVTLFIVMPLGITAFWSVGVANGVPGALYGFPILGFGTNLVLIIVVFISWWNHRPPKSIVALEAKAEGRE